MELVFKKTTVIQPFKQVLCSTCLVLCSTCLVIFVLSFLKFACDGVRVLADAHVPWACEAFSDIHGEELVQNPKLNWYIIYLYLRVNGF